MNELINLSLVWGQNTATLNLGAMSECRHNQEVTDFEG